MTAKKVDLQYRKDCILGITVHIFVKTRIPVSSSAIAKGHFSELSSASIRHTLAELEEEGFLTHPHTSAGRIPTELGYRYFVDHLMDEIEMLNEEKTRIKSAYEEESLELEGLLEKASMDLSERTHYTTIVSVDGWGNKFICRGTKHVVGYPDAHDLDKIQNILAALDEKERLLSIINRDLKRKTEIYIGHEMALSPVMNCSLVVSQYKSRSGTSGRIAVLGPTRMDYQRVVSTLGYFSHLIEENI